MGFRHNSFFFLRGKKTRGPPTNVLPHFHQIVSKSTEHMHALEGMEGPPKLDPAEPSEGSATRKRPESVVAISQPLEMKEGGRSTEDESDAPGLEPHQDEMYCSLSLTIYLSISLSLYLSAHIGTAKKRRKNKRSIWKVDIE